MLPQKCRHDLAIDDFVGTVKDLPVKSGICGAEKRNLQGWCEFVA